MYNPEIGRWWGVDALAEADEDFSPYLYTSNNPVLNIDLFGLTDVNGDGKDDGTILPQVTVIAQRDESTLNNIQLTLDGIGLYPGAGTLAGVVNAGIDIYRGNYGSAGLNLLSVVPVLGTAMKATKFAVMGAKAMSSMAKMKVIKSALVGIAGVRKYNGAITTAKYSQWTKIDGYQIHHIIPQSTLKRFGDDFAKAGFDVDIGDNLRYLQEGFHAKHGAYTKYVRDELQSIIDVNGKLTISDINGVINNMHGLIDKAEAAYKSSGTTLNNFFK
jgi:hypothetical protein